MSASRLRALPVPVSEPHAVRTATLGPPPRAVRVVTTQGALALAYAGEPGAPVGSGRPASDVVDVRRRPYPVGATAEADPTDLVRGVVVAVTEVLAGVRPPSQLVRWTTQEVYAAVANRAALATRLRRGRPAASRPAVVRGVRVCVPAPGVAEASAVVLGEDRVRALALRLEAHDARWRVTVLEFG